MDFPIAMDLGILRCLEQSLDCPTTEAMTSNRLQVHDYVKLAADLPPNFSGVVKLDSCWVTTDITGKDSKLENTLRFLLKGGIPSKEVESKFDQKPGFSDNVVFKLLQFVSPTIGNLDRLSFFCDIQICFHDLDDRCHLMPTQTASSTIIYDESFIYQLYAQLNMGYG